jgi:hypothetical protein
MLTVSSSSVTLAKKYHQAPLESCKKLIMSRPVCTVDDLTHRSGEFYSAGCGTRVVKQVRKRTLMEGLEQAIL